LGCNFHKLAERMFLWLTSPAPGDYGSFLYVFDTPAFYQVSPVGAQNQRLLTVNSPYMLKTASVSIFQGGPEGDAVALDSTGKMRTFVRPKRDPESRALLDRYGKPIEMAHAEVLRDGRATFLDKFGKPITQLIDLSGKTIDFSVPFKTVIINGKSMFLDRSGKVIETVPCAICPAALMAQAGEDKLVYYTVEVNDVYAYFLTGRKAPVGGITANNFPVTIEELRKVMEFAQMKALPNPKVLAVEMKFAWIEASSIPNIEDYITTRAYTPTYDKRDRRHWVREGWEPATLALVGMHIAFSVKDHKEMVWSTFEHVNNAPDTAYRYRVSQQNKLAWFSGERSPECASPRRKGRAEGHWLFSPGALASKRHPSNNMQHMHLGDEDIYASDRIEPSDLLRQKPWGSDCDNDFDNTPVLSVIASVQRQLKSGDVRKNYVMIGTTWSQNGQYNGATAGSPKLANTTIETFVQGSNCLDCHKGSKSNMLGSYNGPGSQGGGGVSHIYDATSPLKMQ